MEMMSGDLIEAFKSVKDSRKPVVVHINTLKGKGYAPAEKNKKHGIIMVRSRLRQASRYTK